jgi:RHH-type rel operon transcriptional repressor/antitoxin RelB
MTTAEKILNVRLPLDISGQLEELVRATGRSKSFLALEALKNYLSAESWQVADIRQGVEEADRGEFATPEEVTATFAKFGVKYDL